MTLDNRRSQLSKKIDRWLGIPLVFAFILIRPMLRLFRRPVIDPSRPRFLVIKLSALGDAVVMLPALYRLRLVSPEAEIAFLGGGSNRAFIEKISAIDKFLPFNFKTVMKLVNENFTAIIDFDQWVRATALMSLLPKCKETVGFRSPAQFRHFNYDKIVDFDNKVHTARNFWNLVQARNLTLGDVDFENDRVRVRTQWRKFFLGRDFGGLPIGSLKSTPIIIHPGCGEHGVHREWPLENWVSLVGKLKKKYPDSEIIITGLGEHEEKLALPLVSNGAVSMVGKLRFDELLALLLKAKMIFCSNTGIMHLASLLNDNITVVNGPTNLTLWRPLWSGRVIESPLECSPCLTWGHDYGCSDPVCMKAITPKDINA